MKNPIVQGWYADPESQVYGGKVYLYVTRSLSFEEQTNLDVVVSKDLENFEIVKDILDMSTFRGATHAVWAPSAVEKDGKYYLIFAANNIFSEEEIGGLYIGVSDNPEGPFKNIYEDGRPFLNRIINGAQPIDAHFYKEGEEIYLYYGGWQHLNFAKLNETLTGIVPLDGITQPNGFLEITPPDYIEAPCVMKIDVKYCLMYYTGFWGSGTYCVRASTADNLYGPFNASETVLAGTEIGEGPGHNGVFAFNGKQYISYHRRIVGDTVRDHRVLCIDEMMIKDGKIQLVKMT